MRTTIDILEELLRRAKAEAALRGMKLKEYVAEVLRSALYEEPSRAEDEPSHDEANQLVLGAECVFPLIRGECGPGMRTARPERIDRILEDEDVEQALNSGRR
jgi:hypothetical protein